MVYAQANQLDSSQLAYADTLWHQGDSGDQSEGRTQIDDALPTRASPPPPKPQPSTDHLKPGMFVGAIAIRGTDQISQAAFSSIVENNIGRNLAEEDLRQLTQQIAEMAHEKGYIFATATIPEQSLAMGVLQVEFDEGQIDEVRITGSDNKALHRLLKSLEGQKAVRSKIERKLVLANDIPKVWVKKTSYISEDDRNILVVKIGERKNKIKAGLDNFGSEGHGPVRARLSFDFRGLLDSADQAGVSFRTNPEDPAEFVYASAHYSTAIGNNGTRVGVSVSGGVTEPENSNFTDLKGESLYFSVDASHPLVRTSDASLWINTELSYLSIKQSDLDILLTEDTEVTLSVGLASNIKLFGGRLRSGASLIQGFDVLGSTRLGNPVASRFDGDGVFTKGRFYANWTGKLGGDWGLYLGAWGQLTNKPLLSAQEMSIGGAYSARGYDFSELSGENGFAGMIELNRTFANPTSWIDELQPYVFLDGGYVNNLDSDFGDGSLISSGGGIRADIGKFNLQLEAAVPLNRDRFETGDRTPQVNIQLGFEI